MGIEVNNESGADVDESALAGLSQFVLDRLGVNPHAELSIVLLDEPAMAALHEQWMDVAGPTDVLAFPMDGEGTEGGELGLAEGAGPAGNERGSSAESESLLGDVVLCPQVAARQASEAGHSTAGELSLLTAHGILHLLGYDHGDPDQEREMFELQATLVRGWTDRTGMPPVHTPLAGTDGQQRA